MTSKKRYGKRNKGVSYIKRMGLIRQDTVGWAWDTIAGTYDRGGWLGLGGYWHAGSLYLLTEI